MDKDSVQRWLDRAGEHCSEVCDYMLRELNLSQGQGDELYTFIQKRAKARRGRAPPGS